MVEEVTNNPVFVDSNIFMFAPCLFVYIQEVIGLWPMALMVCCGSVWLKFTDKRQTSHIDVLKILTH